MRPLTKGQTKITQKNGEFASLDIAIIATNSIGSASVRAYVGVTGTKPNFATKTIEIPAGAKNTGDVAGTVRVKESTAEDAVRYSLKNGTLPGGLAFLNYDEFADGERPEYRNMYALVVTDAAALASVGPGKTSLTVTARNYGAEADGRITVKLASGIKDGGSENAGTANIRETPSALSLPVRQEHETYTDDDDSTDEAITFGPARTITPEQTAVIERAGYMIAAVLPEISVTEPGQYDIEDIALGENVQEGARLIWLAFPDRATEDEDIAEFYDETGAEIEGVPAGHVVAVSAWLNTGVTYSPVIAIEED